MKKGRVTVARENIHTPQRLVLAKRDVYTVPFCPVQLSTLTGFQGVQ